MKDITNWICEWLAAHYRADSRRHFYWRFPDNQWSWAQHTHLNRPDYNYMVITAGDSAYEFRLQSGHFRFHAEGKIQKP